MLGEYLCIVKRHRNPYLGHFFKFKILPDTVADKKHLRVAVVDYVLRVAGIEIL